MEKITPSVNDDSKDDILLSEVHRAITRLKNNKSPGEDGIRGEMIKYAGHEVQKEICKICNMIWKGQAVPKEWTKSILVTIPKKGDLRECKNYRTIALMSHLGKIMMMILQNRLQTHMEKFLADEQAGFRKDRSTIQQILILRLIAEKARRKNRLVYNCFVDFEKAFDSTKHEITWAVLRSYGVGQRLVEILKEIGDQSRAAVRVGQDLGEWFDTGIGTRQGDPISPVSFITYLERTMDENHARGTGISVQGERISNLKFADDIDLLEETFDGLRESLEVLHTQSRRMGLRINKAKTKVMVFGKEMVEEQMHVDGQEIEVVEEFVYLGSKFTWDCNCSKEIRSRLMKAEIAFAGLKGLWNSKRVGLSTKMKVLRTCVFSTALYACETWVLKSSDRDKLMAFEMRCYRKILRISWLAKMRNEDVRRKIRCEENIVQVIMRRKLGLFGHICRMENDRKIKFVVFGMMEGVNKRGRPHREWADDIQEWTGLTLQKLSWEAQDRIKWRDRISRAVSTYGLKQPMDV